MEQLVNIIIWAAIVQGYLLGILFISSKEYSSWSNKLLGFFLLAMLFELTNTLLPIDSIFGYKIGQYFGLPETKILFPVFFLHYVLQKLSRVKPYRKFLKFNYVVAITVMLLTVVNIAIYLINGKSLYDYLTANELEFLHMSQQTYAFLLGVVGIFISIKEMRRYKAIALNEYSDMGLLTLNWLWRFVILLIPSTLLWAAELIRIFIGFYTGEFTDWDFVAPTYFALVIFIYVVSYQAFRRNDLFSLEHDESVEISESEEEVQQVDDKLKSVLLAAMIEDNLYLKVDLTINDVAQAVGATSKRVSGCVNNAFNSNFSEWVNSYRVAEAKQRINSAENDYLTIEAIGQESGFRSRSAMYAAFQKFTGDSPASLRKAN